jgi:predicted ArsR family transcriptional regulator
MQKTTAEEVLTILSKNESLTVFELSTSLNLTKADTRYHIKKLLSDGSIHKVQPEPGKRGRPAYRYKIDNSYYEHNLHTLINAIFSIFPLGDNDISKIADVISSKIGTGKSLSVINKFNDLIIGLNKQNYNARWETHFKGPIIYFSNCPYRQVIHNQPFLCELDKRIIESYIDKKVTILHTICLNGTNTCKFQISV